MLKNAILLSLLSLSLNLAFSQTRLKIVSSLPLTGSSNLQSTGIANGVKMAIEQAGGKIGDTALAYEVWDDSSPARGSWDPAAEAANADRAVADPSVVAYIGPYNSGAAKISMPKLNQAGLLMISPATSWPGLTKPGIGEASEPAVYRPSGKVTFARVVPADDIQGAVAASWAKELGASRVYILHDGELYGKGVASIFKSSSEREGLTVVGFDKIDPKATNYRSLAVRIKQTKPDLVYFGGTTQTNAGQIAKDLKSSGLESKLMVPDGCYESAFIEAAGKNTLEGSTYITFGGLPSDQLTGKGEQFYKQYKIKYGVEPEGYAVYGYEAAQVIIEAVRRTNAKDRASILSAVLATKDFDGALGVWSFDENGDTTLRTMSGLMVEGGQFKLAKILH